jgi:toxin ParE1/3/4
LKIRFVNAAIHELRRATRFYEMAAPGLGGRFASAIDATMLRAQTSSRAGTPIAGGRRRLNVKGFPYSLIVEVWKPGEMVLFIAVAHQKRKPGYWRGRKRPTQGEPG